MSRLHSIARTTRRAWLAGIAVMVLAPSTMVAYAAPATLQVWKDPNCGCCKDWVVHLEKAGFTVKVNQNGNDVVRERLGMPRQLGSCHTALVGGYVIEGHVPANDIKRLLKENPAAIGLSVPGMPVGSPGMDGSVYKGRKDPYDVLLVSKDGTSRVYQAYR